METNAQIMQNLRGSIYTRNGQRYDHWEVLAYLREKNLASSEVRKHFIVRNKPGWNQGIIVNFQAAGVQPIDFG